jgi:hypothetical protein
MMLAFNVFMPLAIGGMVLVMQARGIGQGVGLAVATTGIAVMSAALLFAFLVQIEERPGAPS